MFLSRLILNPRSQCAISACYLASPHDHRTVMCSFPENLDEYEERILYRLDQIERGNQLCLLVQSQLEPDWTQLDSTYLASVEMDNPALKQFELRLVNGQRFTFRLRANPTRRLGQSAGERQGQACWSLCGRRANPVAESQSGDRRLCRGVGLAPQQHRADDRRRDLKFLGVQFNGILHGTDRRALRIHSGQWHRLRQSLWLQLALGERGPADLSHAPHAR